MQTDERKLEMLKPQANKTCSGVCQPKSAQVEPNMSHLSPSLHFLKLILSARKEKNLAHFFKVLQALQIQSEGSADYRQLEKWRSTYPD